MSKTNRKNVGGRSRAHDISVRAVRRDPPDLRKLSRALIRLAMQQAADEAAAEADDRSRRTLRSAKDFDNPEKRRPRPSDG